MRNLIAALSLGVILGFVGGCDKSDTVAVGAGVIDLGKIAHETGRDTVINGQMESLKMQVQTEIRRMEGDIRKKITESAAASKQKPTPEQLNERVSQAEQMMANQRVQSEQQRIISDFRTAIDPAVIKVSQAKGIGMVFIAGSTTIMVTDKSVDLTDDVIAEIKSNKDFFADAGAPPGGTPGSLGEPGGPGMPPPGAPSAPAPGPTGSAAPSPEPMAPTAPPVSPAKPVAPTSSTPAPPTSQPAEPTK